MDRKLSAAMLRGRPDLMSVKDMQDILHIGRSKAYQLLKSKEVKSLRIGSVYRIPKRYLSDYLGKNS